MKTLLLATACAVTLVAPAYAQALPNCSAAMKTATSMSNGVPDSVAPSYSTYPEFFAHPEVQRRVRQLAEELKDETPVLGGSLQETIGVFNAKIKTRLLRISQDQRHLLPPPNPRTNGYAIGQASDPIFAFQLMGPNAIAACFPDLQPVVTAFRERAQTAWQAREQELQEAAIRRAQQAKEENDKRLAALTAAGYKLMTIRDFVLDGRELATSNAKVALDGVYVREGNLDVFYAPDRYYRNQNQTKVLLLTESASRDLRRKMLDCQNSHRSEMGCKMTVMGHTTTCSVSFAGRATREEPCVAVKEGS